MKVELSAASSSEKILLQAQPSGGAGDVPTATLGFGSAAEGTWRFASADLAKLSPGDYRVQVKLAIPDGTGWHGSVAGEPANFALVAAVAPTTPEQQTQRAIALAQEAMLAQDWPRAAQLLASGSQPIPTISIFWAPAPCCACRATIHSGPTRA